MNVELTSITNQLLYLMYKYHLSYTDLGNDGTILFEHIQDLKEKLECPFNDNDIKNSCSELKNAKMIVCSYYDNTVWNIGLTSNAIVYMETRPKNFIDSIVKLISVFKP